MTERAPLALTPEDYSDVPQDTGNWGRYAVVSAVCVGLICLIPNGGADLVIRQAQALLSHDAGSDMNYDIGPTDMFVCYGNLMTKGTVVIDAESPIQSSNQLSANSSNTLTRPDYALPYDASQAPVCRTIDHGQAWYVLDGNQLAETGDLHYDFPDGDGWVWLRSQYVIAK